MRRRVEDGANIILSNLSNPPAGVERLAGAVKARWICERMRHQLEEEARRDHFEAARIKPRLCALIHHRLCAYAFLQRRPLASGGRSRTAALKHIFMNPKHYTPRESLAVANCDNTSTWGGE